MSKDKQITIHMTAYNLWLQLFNVDFEVRHRFIYLSLLEFDQDKTIKSR